MKKNNKKPYSVLSNVSSCKNLKKPILGTIALCGVSAALLAGLANAARSEYGVDWIKDYGANAPTAIASADYSPDEGYVIAGTISTDVKKNYYDAFLGRLPLHSGTNDAYLRKIDLYGNEVWTQTFDGAADESFSRVKVDANNNIYAAGYSNSPEIAAGGNVDAMLSKYNADGELIWNNVFGGSDIDRFEGVLPLEDGGVIAVGYSNSSGISQDESFDAIAVKYDSDGGIVWTKTFGGVGNDFFWSLAEGNDNMVYVVGNTTSGETAGTLTEEGREALLVVMNSENGDVISRKIIATEFIDNYLADIIPVKNEAGVLQGFEISGNLSDDRSDRFIAAQGVNIESYPSNSTVYTGIVGALFDIDLNGDIVHYEDGEGMALGNFTKTYTGEYVLGLNGIYGYDTEDGGDAYGGGMILKVVRKYIDNREGRDEDVSREVANEFSFFRTFDNIEDLKNQVKPWPFGDDIDSIEEALVALKEYARASLEEGDRYGTQYIGDFGEMFTTNTLGVMLKNEQYLQFNSAYLPTGAVDSLQLMYQDAVDMTDREALRTTMTKYYYDDGEFDQAEDYEGEDGEDGVTFNSTHWVKMDSLVGTEDGGVAVLGSKIGNSMNMVIDSDYQYVVKYDKNNNELWSVKLNDHDSTVRWWSIYRLADGGYLTYGDSNDNYTFIQKISDNGELEWEREIGHREYVRDIQAKANGDILLSIFDHDYNASLLVYGEDGTKKNTIPYDSIIVSIIQIDDNDNVVLDIRMDEDVRALDVIKLTGNTYSRSMHYEYDSDSNSQPDDSSMKQAGVIGAGEDAFYVVGILDTSEDGDSPSFQIISKDGEKLKEVSTNITGENIEEFSYVNIIPTDESNRFYVLTSYYVYDEDDFMLSGKYVTNLKLYEYDSEENQLSEIKSEDIDIHSQGANQETIGSIYMPMTIKSSDDGKVLLGITELYSIGRDFRYIAMQYGKNTYYTVNYYDENDILIDSEEYKSGKDFNELDLEIYDNYDSHAWYTDTERTAMFDGGAITEDLDLYFVGENYHTVVYLDENGNIIAEFKNLREGETWEVPAAPSKAEDDEYTYEFASWKEEVSEDGKTTTFKAVYNAIKKEQPAPEKNCETNPEMEECQKPAPEKNCETNPEMEECQNVDPEPEHKEEEADVPETGNTGLGSKTSSAAAVSAGFSIVVVSSACFAAVLRALKRKKSNKLY